MLDEITSEIRTRCVQASRYSTTQRMIDDLLFVGGKQWSETDRDNFGDGRAEIVINLTRQYCNQVINPYRANPFGINVSASRPEYEEKAMIVQRAIKAIETQSNAKSVYTQAIDRQVKCGLGYLGVITDYASNKGFDQVIKLISVADPSMVVYDHLDRTAAGSSGEWCVLVEHVSTGLAKQKYGYVDNDYGKESVMIDTLWAAPEGSVELLTYFRKVYTRETIYLEEDGSTTTKKPRKKTKNRTANVAKVECHKYIGDQKIAEPITLPITRLPIIPVRGEMVDIDKGKVDFVGMVYFARDPAKLINGSAMQTIEKLALAPKATTYVDWRSIVRHKDIWNGSTRSRPPYLPFDKTSPDGKIEYAEPRDRVTAADISDTVTAQQTYQSVLSGVLGLPEGGDQAGIVSNATATEILTKSVSSDMSNYQFSDNLSESIKELGKVIVELLPTIYDTPRIIDDPNEEINISEMGIEVDNLKIDVDAGPMLAGRKREARQQLIALGQIIGPEAAIVYADDIIRATDMPDAEAIATKVSSYVKMKLGVGQETQGQDPEALQALEAAQSTIDQLNQQLQETWRYAQSLEQQVMNSEQDNATKIQIAAMNNASKERQVAMQKQGDLTETQMELLQKSEQAQIEAESDVEQAYAQGQVDRPVVVVQNAEPALRSVGGIRSRIPG